MMPNPEPTREEREAYIVEYPGPVFYVEWQGMNIMGQYAYRHDAIAGCAAFNQALARALAARRPSPLTEADMEAALRAVPLACRLCERGFPVAEGHFHQWHIASQALGMIPETKCEARDPDYPTMARAVLALWGRT